MRHMFTNLSRGNCTIQMNNFAVAIEIMGSSDMVVQIKILNPCDLSETLQLPHSETIEGRAKKEALELEIVKEVCSEIIEFIFIYILFCYSLKHYQRYNPCYKIDFY